ANASGNQRSNQSDKRKPDTASQEPAGVFSSVFTGRDCIRLCSIPNSEFLSAKRAARGHAVFSVGNLKLGIKQWSVLNGSNPTNTAAFPIDLSLRADLL